MRSVFSVNLHYYQVIATCIVLVSVALGSDEPPMIIAYSAKESTICWSGLYSNRVIIVEATANLQADCWAPVYCDLASSWLPVKLYIPGEGYTNVNYGTGTNLVHATRVPVTNAPDQFYRVALRINPPDPSLVLHLSFENDFSNRLIIDSSGYNNHALQFSPSNWPFITKGPDGSQAAGYSPRHPLPGTQYTQGDYAGIPASPVLDSLSNGTVLAWCHYAAESYHNSTIIDAASYGIESATWLLGRSYTYDTRFSIGIGNGTNKYCDALVFPDTINPYVTYDTGGWHHYGVTWDGTNIVGYFDGRPFQTNSQGHYLALRMGKAQWLAIGCKVHQGTPQWGDDLYPNSGWMTGEIDDVRIYNRALSPAEIFNIYASFDKVPPTTPTGVTARAVSSSQIELRWAAATDDLRVEFYRVWRDGVLLGETPAQLYVDAGLSAGTVYEYRVQACDVAGNVSEMSSPVIIATRPPNSDVEVILDELDGAPWVTLEGTWSKRTNTAAYGGFFIQDDNTEKGTKSVTYRPLLPESGRYTVQIWYPYRANGATNIPVDIIFTDTTNTVYVNQRVNGSRWNTLGNFEFTAGTNTLVRCRNDDTSGYVQVDAVLFVK